MHTDLQPILGKILVLSRLKAEGFTSDKPWAAVSISTTGDYAKLNKCQQVGLLQISFADAVKLTPEDLQEEPKLRLFTAEQAATILDFVGVHWDEIEVLLVHCYGGLSRSPAVAAAISKIYYGTDEPFFARFALNRLVYSTIMQVAAERGLTTNAPPIPDPDLDLGCVYCGD